MTTKEEIKEVEREERIQEQEHGRDFKAELTEDQEDLMLEQGREKDYNKKNYLAKDIKNLKEKLLYEATKKIKVDDDLGLKNMQKKEIEENSENDKRTKVKQMKNRLKELVGTFNIIEEAEKISERFK